MKLIFSKVLLGALCFFPAGIAAQDDEEVEEQERAEEPPASDEQPDDEPQTEDAPAEEVDESEIVEEPVEKRIELDDAQPQAPDARPQSSDLQPPAQSPESQKEQPPPAPEPDPIYDAPPKPQAPRDSGRTRQPGNEDQEQESDDLPEEKKTEQKVVERKTYTSDEISRTCKKYNGRLISYYGEIFKVINCQKRRISNSKIVYDMVKRGHRVLKVEAEVVAALEEGEPLDLSLRKKLTRGCKQLERRYVTFSSVDVYYVENCKKRKFPDWETYRQHRRSLGQRHEGEILSLSLVEFANLKEGDAFPSMLDGAFADAVAGSQGADVIPLNEACAGLNGQLAAYYSRLYLIQRCRKREITNPGLYIKRRGGTSSFIELTSEQWVSLPNGKPVTVDRQKTAVKSKH